MAIDYNKMAGIATRLLSPPPKGNGMPVIVRRKVPGTYDPESGKITGETTVDLPAIGLWQARSADYQVTGRGVGGVAKVSDILSQDRQMIIAAVNPDGSTVAPLLTDKVVVPAPAAPLAMAPDANFTDAIEGVAYTATKTASGGTPPYKWSATGIPSWALPAVVSSDTTTWTIAGTAPMDTEMDTIILSLTDSSETWQILSEPKIIKPTTVAIAYVLAMRK
jgi:hypothetical protein